MFNLTLTSRRVKLALAAGAATVAALAPATPSLAAAGNQFPNQRIAGIALSYPVNSHGGQCYVFVNDVLRRASGGRVRIGGSHTYFGAYARAGGVLVSQRDAGAGDVIQISVPSDDNTYYAGMHTAIIIRNLGGGRFDVVDSNWGFTERIHHHVLAPQTLIQRRGESVQFWRMGQDSAPAPAPVAGQPAPPVAQPAPTPPTGVVSTGAGAAGQAASAGAGATTGHPFAVAGLPAGNRLLIRTGPGTQYPSTGSLANGAPVSVLCQTVGSLVASSKIWDQIGPGQYVSDWFLNTPVVGAFTPGLGQCSAGAGHAF